VYRNPPQFYFFTLYAAFRVMELVCIISFGVTGFVS
jgi:hypothetical protein